MSYTFLKKIHNNGGFLWAHPARIFLERVFRLLPLYVFMIFFLWKFIGLFGGSGPRFYLFEENHGCQDTWFFHMFMINNVIPLVEKDYCLSDSWYIANDIWFMFISLIVIEKYYKNQKMFFL